MYGVPGIGAPVQLLVPDTSHLWEERGEENIKSKFLRFFNKQNKLGKTRDLMLDKKISSQKPNQQKSDKKVIRRRRPLSLPTRSSVERGKEVIETVSVATQTEKYWWKLNQGLKDSVINKEELKNIRNNNEDSDDDCSQEVFQLFKNKATPFPGSAITDQRKLHSVTVR